MPYWSAGVPGAFCFFTACGTGRGDGSHGKSRITRCDAGRNNPIATDPRRVRTGPQWFKCAVGAPTGRVTPSINTVSMLDPHQFRWTEVSDAALIPPVPSAHIESLSP